MSRLQLTDSELTLLRQYTDPWDFAHNLPPTLCLCFDASSWTFICRPDPLAPDDDTYPDELLDIEDLRSLLASGY